MRADLNILGEASVYPGHPAVIAYLILHEYAGRLDEAFERGVEYPRALENTRIPGAGGNVRNALDMLQHMLGGAFRTIVDALDYADYCWHECDGQGRQSSVYYGRWRAGQEQAERIKPRLLEMLEGLNDDSGARQARD